METILAPRVVIPPCARSSAWNTSTIAPKTLTAAGPKSTAPKPFPVGWEVLPVTEGSFKDDKININAPVIASNGFDSGCSSVTFLIWITP